MPPGPGVGEEEEEELIRGVDSGGCCSPSPPCEDEGVGECGGELLSSWPRESCWWRARRTEYPHSSEVRSLALSSWPQKCGEASVRRRV